jgi:leucyl/phenylalanyl-tRNA--protein transferase
MLHVVELMSGPVLLTDALVFPPPSWATRDGLIAVGGDLRPERLVLAYGSGIFPWPHEGMPLLWFCPNPRMVLRPRELHVSHSLRKVMRKNELHVTLDRDFGRVIRACARTPRSHENGTWITDEIIDAYTRLHLNGLAHSVEVWQEGSLVGGLYGVSLGAAFFGESMFARASNASKVGFATLVQQLDRWGFRLVDCQMYTPHLARFGATPWPREDFLDSLEVALREPTRRGCWQLGA